MEDTILIVEKGVQDDRVVVTARAADGDRILGDISTLTRWPAELKADGQTVFLKHADNTFWAVHCGRQPDDTVALWLVDLGNNTIRARHTFTAPSGPASRLECAIGPDGILHVVCYEAGTPFVFNYGPTEGWQQASVPDQLTVLRLLKNGWIYMYNKTDQTCVLGAQEGTALERVCDLPSLKVSGDIVFNTSPLVASSSNCIIAGTVAGDTFWQYTAPPPDAAADVAGRAERYVPLPFNRSDRLHSFIDTAVGLFVNEHTATIRTLQCLATPLDYAPRKPELEWTLPADRLKPLQIFAAVIQGEWNIPTYCIRILCEAGMRIKTTMDMDLAIDSSVLQGRDMYIAPQNAIVVL